MDYASETFDMAIDKSTIDALLCGDDSFVNVARMIRDIQRVLKTGGYYFVISYGVPDNRELHFKRDNLKLDLQTIKLESKQASNGAVRQLMAVCVYVFLGTLPVYL